MPGPCCDSCKDTCGSGGKCSCGDSCKCSGDCQCCERKESKCSCKAGGKCQCAEGTCNC